MEDGSHKFELDIMLMLYIMFLLVKTSKRLVIP